MLDQLPAASIFLRARRTCAAALQAARAAPARALQLCAASLGSLALIACADSALRHGQGDLAALQRALPGIYTSSSAGAGAAGASAVSLSIQPITAQVLGDAVYFVRETPADNPRLVLAQGIWTLSLGNAGSGKHEPSEDNARIVQHRFLFKDPRRWVGAADNPDLLLSILPQDLQALSGCDLVWYRTSMGFETERAPQPCHPGSNAQGVWFEEHARLQGAQLSLTERQTGADGALDTSGAPLSLQLERTGGAQ